MYCDFSLSSSASGCRLSVAVPICVRCLGVRDERVRMTRQGDQADSKWAIQLLSAVSGPGSWLRIMTAALAGDALLLSQKFIRKDDEAATEVYFKATEAHVEKNGAE